MILCDRCRRQLTDGAQQYTVEVKFFITGRPVRDERTLFAMVCLGCYEAIERQITNVLPARSVFGPIGEYAAGPVLKSNVTMGSGSTVAAAAKPVPGGEDGR